jgi:hypothetical protein
MKGSGKIASLCGSKQLGVDGGYLQYRFGKLPIPEMQYPIEKKGSLKQFAYEHYFRALVDRVTISFSNNGHDYEVFSDQEADQKPPILERGVRVHAAGKIDKVTTLLCGPQYLHFKTDALGAALSSQQ